MKYNPISIAVKTALGLSIAAALPLGSAYAEEGAEEIVEEVMVTGSRIQRSPIDTVGPITVLDSRAIEQSGAISIEELINEMPSISLNGTNANDANGGSGTHFSGIHNLSEQQTLVLVNGRRFTPTILGSGLAVDLNNIPTKMVDRIEVLADGASAVYGSDAVAGVINIILKKDMMDGILEIGGGITSEGDRETVEFSVTKGGSIGNKGSFVAGLSYADRKEVLMKDRDWATTPVLWELGGGQQLIGSGIPPEGVFSVFEPSDATVYTQTQVDADEDGEYQQIGTNQFRKGTTNKYIFDAAGNAIEEYSTFDQSKGHRFNYNTGEGDKPADLISPVTNLNTFFSGNYDINSTTSAFAELALSTREGTYQMMGLPISGSHGKYTDMIPLPLDNPNIPSAALTLLQNDPAISSAGQVEYTWRSQDLGQRFFEFEGQTINLITGLEGQLDNWDWEAFVGYGNSTLDETTENQVNVTNLRTAVDPDLCAADAECASAFASTGGAIDIFGRNTYTQAQKDYVLFTDTESTEYTQKQLGFSASSDLLMLPAGALGFAAGVEYREEEGSSTKSPITVAGDSGGNFAEPTSGSYEVAEVFAEVNVPLLYGQPFAEELTLDAAARYSDYSTFGGESTYRIGLSYAPVYGLRFRGVTATAYRAPNIMELFGGTADSYVAISDPCSDYANSTDQTVVDNCTDAGVPSNYIQDAGQLRVSVGGNPDLEAETAETTTFGIVFTAVENLSLTLDYYTVEVEDAVGTPTESDVISGCYATPGLNNTECDRIERNAQGKITKFLLLNENLDSVKSEGIDATASYTMEVAGGELYTNLLASYIIEYSETTVDGVTNDKTNQVFCSQCGDSMYPEFRTNLTVGYDYNNWGVSLTHRYLPEMEIVALFGADDVLNGTKSDAKNYFDVAGTYSFNDFKVIAGIDNIGDVDPDFIPDVSNNTSDGFDWLGRYYYAKLQYQF